MGNIDTDLISIYRVLLDNDGEKISLPILVGYQFSNMSVIQYYFLDNKFLTYSLLDQCIDIAICYPPPSV